MHVVSRHTLLVAISQSEMRISDGHLLACNNCLVLSICSINTQSEGAVNRCDIIINTLSEGAVDRCDIIINTSLTVLWTDAISLLIHSLKVRWTGAISLLLHSLKVLWTGAISLFRWNVVKRGLTLKQNITRTPEPDTNWGGSCNPSTRRLGSVSAQSYYCSPAACSRIICLRNLPLI